MTRSRRCSASSRQGEEEAEVILSKHEARHDVEDRLFQRKIVERLTGIAEGRIEAAPPEESEQNAEGSEQDAVDDGQSDDDAESSADDLAEAGGAAEVLGTGDADTDSQNETGDAEGGGTPTTAPGLGGDKEEKN